MIQEFKLKMNKYFNGDVRDKLQKQAESIGIKGKNAIDVISTTTATVKEILQAELKNGNYSGVITFLKESGLKVGKDVVLDKIIQRVVGRLILRFGLPGSVALTLATILVPFIVKRIGKKALKSGKVQDLLNSLGVNEHVEKINILKNQVKDKFNLNHAA